MSRRNRNKEAGQALIFGAVTLGILLMGMAGLGIDMGYLRYQKRLLQAAADAAAIAGASDLPTNFGGVDAAAQNAAAANGYTVASLNLATCPPPAPAAAVGSISLTVNNGPCSGPHVGLSSYVEVYLSQVQPTFFMHIFNVTSQTITARAVATSLVGGPGNGCLYTLGPPSSGIGVNIQGSAILNANEASGPCGIIDNGNFDPTGANIQVNAGSFSVSDPNCAGNNAGCNKGTVTCAANQTKCPDYGAPAGPDPLAYLTAPAQPAASTSCPGSGACNVSAANGQMLQPGTYSSISIGKNAAVTMSPGIYYIDGTGGVSFNGGGSLSGTGVMFYFTCPAGTAPCSSGPTLDATGGGSRPDIELTAPSTLTGTNAQYNGVLFYQDSSDTTGPNIGGDDNSNYTGALYFPTAQITFYGDTKSNGTGFNAGVIISDSISFQGNPTINLLGQAGLPTGVNLVATAVLVE